MSKSSLGFTTSVLALLSLTPCQAVPSLLCVPKTSFADSTEATENKKDNQVTARRIRVYYVNGHRMWEATALVVNDQVKAIITKGSLGRSFVQSKIDSNGFGSGVDFRGMPWEFHGFLDPSNFQRQGSANFGSSQK